MVSYLTYLVASLTIQKLIFIIFFSKLYIFFAIYKSVQLWFYYKWKKSKTWFEIATHSRSSIQNFNTWRLWIRKIDPLLNLIAHQHDIDKIYLYPKHFYELKYQLFMKNLENAGVKRLIDPKALIEYSDTMNMIFAIILMITIQNETEKS